jgi:hypothetical protein
MEITIQVPKAFSVRDENEFFAFQHLIARMNPLLRVATLATGVHVNGGCTVFWGLVYSGNQKLTRDDVERALAEAGFDLKRNAPIHKLDLACVEGTAA